MKPRSAVVKNIAMTTTLAGTFLSLPSLVSAHFGKELLYKGQHSEHVKSLQTVLKTEGYYKLTKPTGYFGSTTEKAVKEFQKDHDLKVDGLVGPKTKAKLSKYVKQDHNLTIGSKGPKVKEIQETLKRLGYYTGHLDGIYGTKTRLSVLNFQKTNHLSMDGIVGPNTLKRLHGSPKRASRSSETVQTVQKTSRSIAASSNVMYVSATAYTAYCAGCSGKTATGINLRANPNSKVVAVDPNIIPLGTKLYIEGYGYAVAGDTGGAIRGKHVDLFMSSRDDALKWGRRTVKVTILGS
ncbi:peptidoglycan-binding protein [Pullulanibacillus sp. KACC 23026]|uniref:peptidoglycan-binding protein n=1 Tax=Pullulanibacillus sp. KACC 23026 TaxID=3028315 RepID=UPI0023B0BBFE|nr:peptidoglycan-binding protein [Pullulanibacillus sp. KACC 23026]WEG12540.1 peptidoglycan-binding protein [Pullulanibacillus sp. KACC 23026]